MANTDYIPGSVGHVHRALESDVRYDGRAREQFRDVSIETSVTSTAEGSAIVTAGDCKVMAGVKLSLGTPYPDSPDEGVLMVSCELLPMAHNSIEMGPPRIDAIEIGRVIDRGIRESHAFDTKQLCIEKGEKVWIVSVDIVPLNHDGNIIDLGAIAALAALKATKFPQVNEDGNVDYKSLSKNSLVLEKEPIPVTVCKVRDQIFIDPSKEEEDAIEARVTVTCLDEENICSLQKGGDESFSVEELDDAFTLALKTSAELRKKL
ncbi:MAG: RNA-binding protein [Candidatus Woesearchaeota archaeon]